MPAKGTVGQQHRLAQKTDRVVRRQGHQPSLGWGIRGRHLQIRQAGQGRHRQVKIDRAAGLADLPHQGGQTHQLIDQRQMVLEGLEGCGNGPGLGFALRQGGHGLHSERSIGLDLAEAEAVVL